MARAIPVHSSKQGKQENEVSPQSSEVESAGPVQPSESGVPGVTGEPEGAVQPSASEATIPVTLEEATAKDIADATAHYAANPSPSVPPVQLEPDLGYKLESHQAYRKDN